MAWLNAAYGWRAIFGWGALAILLSALALMLAVRNTPPGVEWRAGAAGGAGFAQVFRDLRFWRIALLNFFHVGVLLAVQGLWGGPYLLDVAGLVPLAVGNLLLAMGAGVIAGYFVSGWLADRYGVQRAVTISAAALVVCLAGLALPARLPLPLVALLYCGLGFCGAFNIMELAQVRLLFPPHMSGRAVNYVASPPDTAIDRLVSDHRKALDELERGANAMIGELAAAFQEGQHLNDPLDYIEVLRDRRAINERFAELQEGIKEEILVFTKPPYATPPQEEEKGLEVAASHSARSVYEFSIFDDPATIAGVQHFIEAGEQARFVEQLPLKLVIIDERYVMFGMEDPVAGSSELTMMVVEHPSLAATLKAAFETFWTQGISFDEANERFGQAAS